jgi:hypothetical protein
VPIHVIGMLGGFIKHLIGGMAVEDRWAHTPQSQLIDRR